jgi:RND family efflux transporter MFP subunit
VYADGVIPRTVRPLGLCAALLLAAACNRSQADAPKPAGQAGGPRPLAVTVDRAVERATERSVETTGSLLAWEEVQARAEQSGTIARLRVDLGDRVEAGQVLADYDRREFELMVEQARAAVAQAVANLRRQRDALATLEAEVARAQSQYEWAQAELERAQQLFDRQLVARRDVDNARTAHQVAAAQLAAARVAVAQHPDQVRVAEAELERARAALGIAEKRLADTTVRAPISGLVARRHVAAGEFVKDNTPLFTLVVPHPLKYVGTVPERAAPALRIGQTVRLAVEAYPDRTFTGTVTRLAPAVDVQTRTLALEARVPNDSGALRPGFFAKGSVVTQPRARAVYVPAEAVTYVAGLTKVFVIADGVARERLVRTGERAAGWVEILPDEQPARTVKAGEVVATANLPSLFDGAPVTVAAR